MKVHELTVDGLVTSGVGDVVIYDSDAPVSVRIDSTGVLVGGLDWLETTALRLDPIDGAVQITIGTGAGGLVAAVFRGDDERLWAHVAIDGPGGQQVHLAELGGRARVTPIVSVPNRGYVYETSGWRPDGTRVQQWTCMVSEEGSWHRTTWEHSADAVAFLCRDFGLVTGKVEL